jgi:hypothetical protein
VKTPPPPPNMVKDAQNFRFQAEFYQSKAYPYTKLYLRWIGGRWIVDGWYPSGGWSRSCALKTQLEHSRRGHSDSEALLQGLEKAVLQQFASLDMALSPEALTWDGERPQAEVEVARRDLMAQVEALAEAWGRMPTANEVHGRGGDYPISGDW